MIGKQEIELRFKDDYIANSKTNGNIDQLHYFDFGPVSWDKKDDKVGPSEVSVADFLKMHNLDESAIDSRHVFLGFSKNGKNVEIGYDHVEADLFLLFDNFRNNMRICDSYELYEVIFECPCNDELWDWITTQSFFVDGSEF